MVEKTPYYQGRSDFEEGKKFAPPYYNVKQRAEWLDGWVDAQESRDEEEGIDLDKEGPYLILAGNEKHVWVNEAERTFANVESAKIYAQENNLFDVAIMKLERFV